MELKPAGTRKHIFANMGYSTVTDITFVNPDLWLVKKK